MKLAINYKPIDGPWGGGNRFVISLVNRLKEDGHDVHFDLNSKEIDIILIIDPRWRNKAVTFTTAQIFRYLLMVNPKAIVVHRINECDERKNSRDMNRRLRKANYCADHTVFVGSWLRHLNVYCKPSRFGDSVILNGADDSIFKSDTYKPWDGQSKLKIVTHHWGANQMKGFDIYGRLDEMLGEDEWGRQIEFTYIGNVPKNFIFKNMTLLRPLDGTELAKELSSHHVYLTASINEPGGNHQNEGALCGLPLLYRASGCMPEYCNNFGIEFDESNFELRLKLMMDQYQNILQKMPNYPWTAENTCKAYIDLFEYLIELSSKQLSRRQLFRRPVLALLNQLPM